MDQFTNEKSYIKLLTSGEKKRLMKSLIFVDDNPITKCLLISFGEMMDSLISSKMILSDNWLN